jgi:hypothetical protein
MNMELIAPAARLLTVAAALAVAVPATAQEQLPRTEALKYAFAVSADLNALLATPIPSDPDLKRPVAVREGDYGGMVLPESKLTAAALENVGKDGMAVAQLWLLKLVPMQDSQPVPSSRLRFVEASTDEGSASVPCCVIAVRKAATGGLELVLLGKDKTPLLASPLKTISRNQKDPVEMLAERQSDGGLITLRILGKYEASFMVTDPDQF